MEPSNKKQYQNNESLHTPDITQEPQNNASNLRLILAVDSDTLTYENFTECICLKGHVNYFHRDLDVEHESKPAHTYGYVKITGIYWFWEGE